jgi:excisionase family DNA binding protein
MSETSYSTGKAARRLGISIPTLQRKCDAGEIPYFLTPGGHRRIPADAIGHLLGNVSAAGVKRGVPKEQAKLAGQEFRTQAEAEDFRVEPPDQEEIESTHTSSYQFTRNVDSEATRSASARPVRQMSQDRELEGPRRQLEEFHQRWRRAAADMLPSWLSFEQHEAAVEALDRAIIRCSEQDDSRMPWIVSDAIARLLAPLERERQTAMRRDQVLQRALWNLSASASTLDKAQATATIRKVLADLPLTALDYEERAAAEEAICKMNEQVKGRLTAEERERTEKEVQARKAREQQQCKLRKESLVQQGIYKVSWCLMNLLTDDVLSVEDYEDIDQESLKHAVEKILQAEVTGDETNQELDHLVKEIVADELDIEVADEFDEED